MITDTLQLKEICNKILPAVDNTLVDPQHLTSTLELIGSNNQLTVNVTNREYYVSASLNAIMDESFHATVNAVTFLKLISQMTSPEINLTVKSNALQVKGNGNYKLPLIFDNDKLLELPKINIDNITCEMDVPNKILQDINKFNSKELKKLGTKKQTHPLAKMYYIDEQGAITFNSGACVNSFQLEKPIRLLLNDKLVKLFKLFTSDVVHMEYGIDQVNEMLQSKIKFTSQNVIVSALLGDISNLMGALPLTSIRKRANDIYDYNIEFSKDEFIAAINRLLIFKANQDSVVVNFEFGSDSLVIEDKDKKNQETIKYLNDPKMQHYSALIDIMDLKLTLDSYNEESFNLCCGNHTNIMTIRGNIKNIIPEIAMIRE